MKNSEHTNKLAILGGTFDPPHKAHLAIALEACEQAKISEIAILPCHIPALKSSPSVAAEHRLNMLKLATDGSSGIYIDERELLSNSTSYTVETLETLKTEKPDTTLFFIIGTDNLKTFEKWHRWQDILKLCHLIVCRRSNADIQEKDSLSTLNSRIKNHLTTDIRLCQNVPVGYIYLADTTLSDISSTEIRHALEQDHDVSKWLEPQVYNYIKQYGLYQRTHKTC